MYLVRFATHWFFVKLFFVLFFLSTRSLESESVKDALFKDCPEEFTDEITWPSTPETSCSSSEPLCINNFEITQRCCLANQTWETNPTCSNIQETVSSLCPDGSIQEENICIFIIKTVYPPNCPFEETLGFESYMRYVNDDMAPIWLPVERVYDTYGEGLFYWNEQSSFYKNPFIHSYLYEGPLLDKNCLLFYNESYIEAVSCTETHSGICAYTILTKKTSTFCSQSFDASCKQSDYSTKSKCFCQKNQTGETINNIELLVPYQNLLYTSLDEVCYIGLEKKDDVYIWTNSNVPINYTFWSANCKFGKENSFGAMSPDGWILKSNKEEENCNLIQKSPPDIDDEMSSLKLTLTDDNTLVALPENVAYWKQTDSNPMIFCFTDVYSDHIIQKINTTRKVINGKVGVEFSLLNNGPGHYWCEGFLYPDLNVKKSNIYFDQSTNPEYVGIFSTSYSSKDNPLSEEFIKTTHGRLVQSMANLEKSISVMSSFYPRIYKINEVNEITSKVTFNFHITTRDNLNQFTVYSLLLNAVKVIPDFCYVNFLFTSVCIGSQTSTEQGDSYTWPTTSFGQVAIRPHERWCIDNDGTIITRSCEGNFIDGATWSKMEKQCSQEQIKPTLILKHLITLNNTSIYMSLVSEILSTRPGEFEAIDVDLIADVLKRLSEENVELDITAFVDLIDGIINIDENILKKSQQDFNSTDKILENIQEVLKKSNFRNSVTTNSISIISLSTDDFYTNSIFWKKTENGYTANFVNLTESDPYNFDFDSGLIFNRDLLDEIININKSRIIIIAYFKGSLFNEEYFQRYTSTIFSIIFSNLTNLKTEDLSNFVVTIYNTSDEEDQNMLCSYWAKDTGKTRGYWYHKSRTDLVNSKMLCSFKKLTNIGIVPINNVTAFLQELQDHQSCPEILNQIKMLLNIFSTQFTYEDIILTNELLLRCQTEIEAISDIFDSLLDLPSTILISSKTEQNILLTTFNSVLKNATKADFNIQKKNFAVLIIDLLTSNVVGFHVENCEHNCEIIPDYQKNTQTNYEIIFQMDLALIKQLTVDGFNQIIFILFSNNALFLTKDFYESKDSSKVVGILIDADTMDNLSGDILIDYNTENYSENHTCDYWLGDHWNHYDPPVNTDNLYKCKFWTLGYYALHYNNVNVTALIEEALNSDLSTLEILKLFANITQIYKDQFKALDIDLIASYLSDINNADKLILEECAYVITNIMDFNRIVLKESESSYLSTNKLIHALNKVAEQLKTPIFLCNSKLIMISLVKKHDVAGIMIDSIQEPCQIELIENTIPESINTGIVLKNDLNKEINDAATLEPTLIIFTVFYDNSLFNEENDQKKINIIFGLHIPGYNHYLSNDITVYYNGQSINSEHPGCVYWNFMKNHQVIPGSWQLEQRANHDFTCNHYKQGYFTLWDTSVNDFNITAILEDIYISTESTVGKLERLESVSTFYDSFKAVDVSLLSLCVSQLNNFNTDCVIILKRIGSNYFRIPSIIKHESQIKFNATSSILDFLSISGLSLKLNEAIRIDDYFQFIKCDTGKSNKSITISTKSLDCFGLLDDQTYTQVTYISTLLTETSVSMFTENDLFVDKESSATSKIIGISLPNPPDDLSIEVSFKQNVVTLPNYACGIWEFVPEENGKWTYISTKKSTSETNCIISNVKSVQYVALLYFSFTTVLDDISSSSQTYSEKISAILDVVPAFRDQFEPIHIDMIHKILNNGEPIDENDVRIIAGVIDKLMDLDREILATAQFHYNATEKLLFCIDNLVIHFKGEVSIVDYTNFALVIQPNVSGLIFEQSDKLTYTIKNILYDDEDSDNIATSNTSLIISNLNKSPSKLYISVYFNNALFNGKYERIVRNKGIIVGVEISDTSPSDSLRVYFDNYQNETNICAYWNHKTVNKETQTGYWETIKKNPCENQMAAKYFALLEEYNVTNDLQQILDSNISLDDKLVEVGDVIRNNTNDLVPYDIFLISEILSLLRNYANTTKEQVELTSQIISILFKVDESILEESQHQFRATDSLLFTTDEVVRKCGEEIEYPIVNTNFTTAKIDVKKSNISCLIFKDCTSSTCSISFLNDQNIDNTTFKTALVFSTDLLKEISENDGPVNLIVTVYFHDNFFNENPRRNVDTSHVLGVLLEGLNTDLQGKLYLMYNMEDIDLYNNRSCAYWKYQVTDAPVRGFWQNDVSPTSRNGFVVCEYDHLTHFVLLLASSSSIIDQLNDSYILDIITNINSVLSLFGLFGILLTTVLFDRWRNNTGNQILINFSVAISIKNVMLYISEGIYTEGDKSMACTITGGILHYSILSEFCWMLIIAILQFKRFVEVLGGPLKYVLLKACICGWVFPALPIFLIIIVDVNNYNKSEIGLCYPSGFGLYLGIWLPLVVIISINFIIFVFILYNVFHKKTEYRDQVNHEILFQWRLAILLFLMLGLTWSFGFLCLIFESSLFAILFCFLATLQGFIMFLFFIVFNKNTRYLYVQCFSSWMYYKGYKDRLK